MKLTVDLIGKRITRPGSWPKDAFVRVDELRYYGLGDLQVCVTGHDEHGFRYAFSFPADDNNFELFRQPATAEELKRLGDNIIGSLDTVTYGNLVLRAIAAWEEATR